MEKQNKKTHKLFFLLPFCLSPTLVLRCDNVWHRGRGLTYHVQTEMDRFAPEHWCEISVFPSQTFESLESLSCQMAISSSICTKLPVSLLSIQNVYSNQWKKSLNVNRNFNYSHLKLDFSDKDFFIIKDYEMCGDVLAIVCRCLHFLLVCLFLVCVDDCSASLLPCIFTS